MNLFPNSIIINYPKDKYDFKSVIERIFNCQDLSKLHLSNSVEYPTFDEFTDQSTKYHELFYSKMDQEFLPLYNQFLLEGIKDVVFEGVPLICQKVPTFRISLPGNVAVGNWHKDRDFGHDPHEINFWMPFTEAFNTNTIWIESEEDKGDFEPIRVENGEIFVFDGANLKHGNKTNDTGLTRVSVDFRVIPESLYTPSDKVSITKMSKFEVGDYWIKV